MAPRGTILSRGQVRKMMEAARRTSLGMREAERHRVDQQLNDPLERAKLALRRAGTSVFNHSLLAPASTLVVVGSRTMTHEEVITHAERFGRW